MNILDTNFKTHINILTKKNIATKQIEAIRGKGGQSGIKRIKTGEFWKEDIAEEFSKSEEDEEQE